MSGHSTYQPQSRFMQWFERRLPIVSLIHSSFVAYPTPRNLNYWWTFGGILSFLLGAQIAEGRYEKALAFCGSGMGIHVAASKVPRFSAGSALKNAVKS